MIFRSPAYKFNHSFGPFLGASSSLLLLRSAPDITRIVFGSFTPKRHRQLRAKNLPKVTTRGQERDSNPRPSGRKVLTLPMRHQRPTCYAHKCFQYTAVTFIKC